MKNLLTENIDIWTSAQIQKNGTGRGNGSGNQSLYGIKKLRELILELAVRGKLVPQDPKDEQASVLLEKITKEKTRLIKEGKIKKEKPLPEISEDEKPFKLPPGWVWARIGNVGHDWGQKTPDKDFTYIEVSGIDNVLGNVKLANKLTAEEAPSRARKIVKTRTVIYSTVRPYLKNICVIDKEYHPEPIASTAFAILHPFQTMPGKFFALYFRSPLFVNYVESVQTGIAYPAINDKQFFSGIIPLPPLAEQHRIVAKVDELMALCDKLEQHQADSNTAHQTLVETLLAPLTSAADANEFAEAWQRIAENFAILFTTEQSIDRLKQTILQLAVMGKLVPQDPNDEPASVLLEKIAKEKARLIKEGKIKKEKPLPEISEDEKPFRLPYGWAWTRLGDILLRISNGFSGKQNKNGNGYPLSRIETISYSKIDMDKIGYSPSIPSDKIEYYKLESGDILLSHINSDYHVGKTAVVPIGIELYHGVNLILLRLHKLIDPTYIDLVINTLRLSGFFIKIAQHAIGQSSINQSKLIIIPIALSPLAEQHRIVSKVDELMTLCDALKTRLQEAQTTQIHLADAIVEQAVE